MRMRPSSRGNSMIPALLLKKLYTVGSLKNTQAGAQFALKNRLSDAELTGLRRVAIDGHAVALEQVRLDLEDGRVLTPQQVSLSHPVPFPLRSTVTIQIDSPALNSKQHEIEVAFEAKPFGRLELKVEDAIHEDGHRQRRIPRSDGDDYSAEIIQERRAFVEQLTGVKLKHIAQCSFDPHLARGNC